MTLSPAPVGGVATPCLSVACRHRSPADLVHIRPVVRGSRSSPDDAVRIDEEDHGWFCLALPRHDHAVETRHLLVEVRNDGKGILTLNFSSMFRTQAMWE